MTGKTGLWQNFTIIKLLGKYNKQVGNKIARDLFWFYIIFFYFPMKEARATFIEAREIPGPTS